MIQYIIMDLPGSVTTFRGKLGALFFAKLQQKVNQDIFQRVGVLFLQQLFYEADQFFSLPAGQLFCLAKTYNPAVVAGVDKQHHIGPLPDIVRRTAVRQQGRDNDPVASFINDRPVVKCQVRRSRFNISQ